MPTVPTAVAEITTVDPVFDIGWPRLVVIVVGAGMMSHAVAWADHHFTGQARRNVVLRPMSITSHLAVLNNNCDQVHLGQMVESGEANMGFPDRTVAIMVLWQSRDDRLLEGVKVQLLWSTHHHPLAWMGVWRPGTNDFRLIYEINLDSL